MSEQFTAIDLFCGAGGMSLGFEQAGVKILGAFDREEFNVCTYNKNFPGGHARKVDLSEQSGESLRKLCKPQADSEIDVVFGGPPCQGFSIGGKQREDDERNLLVYDFSRLVRELHPKYFVMENVKGLMSYRSRPVLNSLLRRLKLAGYTVINPVEVLNAADFGVPQRRLRTFIIGARKELRLPSYPEATTPTTAARRTVRHAIADLQNVDSAEALLMSDVFTGELTKRTSVYAKRMRCILKDEEDLSSPRPQSHLTGCLRTLHSAETTKRFRKTKQGGVEEVSRYFRLSWDELSPTLRAGTGPDHGSHTAPRPIHPDRPRCITTREAARLHSFPDWFQFHGTRWHDFRQIGNAVPPLLARAVAKEIVKALET
jgi:DNA (cytosine-5)-methyltransferase 1